MSILSSRHVIPAVPWMHSSCQIKCFTKSKPKQRNIWYGYWDNNLKHVLNADQVFSVLIQQKCSTIWKSWKLFNHCYCHYINNKIIIVISLSTDNCSLCLSANVKYPFVYAVLKKNKLTSLNLCFISLLHVCIIKVLLKSNKIKNKNLNATFL